MSEGKEIDCESLRTDYSGGHTDLTGRRIKQSHKQLRSFYCLSYIIRTIKTRSMRWVVYIARAYKNPGRKTPLGSFTFGWDVVKSGSTRNGTSGYGLESFGSRQRVPADQCGHGNEADGFHDTLKSC